MRVYNFQYLNELNILKEKKRKKAKEIIKKIINKITFLGFFL